MRIYTLVAVRGKLYRAYIYARGSKRVKQAKLPAGEKKYIASNNAKLNQAKAGKKIN